MKDDFLLDRDKPISTSNEQSMVEDKGDVGSTENTLTDTPRSVVEASNLTGDIDAAVDELRCDTLLNEISTIYYARDKDQAVHEVISNIIDQSRNLNHAAMAVNLDCAGRLAKKSHYARNKDQALAMVIERNIQVYRCRAARELTNHLVYARNSGEQKVKVVRQCLGRK